MGIYSRDKPGQQGPDFRTAGTHGHRIRYLSLGVGDFEMLDPREAWQTEEPGANVSQVQVGMRKGQAYLALGLGGHTSLPFTGLENHHLFHVPPPMAFQHHTTEGHLLLREFSLSSKPK
jgi:hypothetical protein